MHTPSSLSPTTKELAIKTETERDIIEEEDVINLTEPDAELPVAKKAKVFDGERIIMGQQLSDVEINFAQQLLKEQFQKSMASPIPCIRRKELNVVKLQY